MVLFGQMLNFKLKREARKGIAENRVRRIKKKDSQSDSVKKVLSDSNQKLIIMVRE